MTHSRQSFWRSINWTFVARLMLAAFLGAATAWAMMSVAGCSSTSIKPASTSLSRTTTAFENGKPVRSETVSGETSGPGIHSDDPRAIEMATETPTLALPGAGDSDALSAGSGRSSVSGKFGQAGKALPAICLLLGIGFMVGGLVAAVKFAELVLGASAIGLGAFLCWAAFEPWAFAGVFLCLAGFGLWTLWKARQHDQDKTALTVVAGAVDSQDQPVTVEMPDGSKITDTINATKAKIKTAATGATAAVESAIKRAKARK